jgi:hypothetical protein
MAWKLPEGKINSNKLSDPKALACCIPSYERRDYDLFSM